MSTKKGVKCSKSGGFSTASKMTIQFEDTTITIAMYNDPYLGHYGYAPRENKGKNEVILKVGNHKTVGELASTACHELCHKVLNVEHKKLNTDAQHSHIYPVQMRYVRKYSTYFSKKYYDDTEQKAENAKLQQDNNQNGGWCSGSLILSILVFLGLLGLSLTRTLKRR